MQKPIKTRGLAKQIVDENIAKQDRTIKDPLRKDKYGTPLIDPEATGKPHTQLGTKISKRSNERSYIQGREFD